METELTLSRGGFPPFSARGCTQELFPVPTGQMKRTLDGTLVFVGGQAFPPKYASLIKGQDKTVPALEGIWRGSVLKVGCLQRLWQKIPQEIQNQGGNLTLERDPVPHSLGLWGKGAEDFRWEQKEGRQVSVGRQQREGNVMAPPSGELFLSYRPWLDMRVQSFSLFTDEWGMKSGWQLGLEEI